MELGLKYYVNGMETKATALPIGCWIQLIKLQDEIIMTPAEDTDNNKIKIWHLDYFIDGVKFSIRSGGGGESKL